jgi:hypothetical protein
MSPPGGTTCTRRPGRHADTSKKPLAQERQTCFAAVGSSGGAMAGQPALFDLEESRRRCRRPEIRWSGWRRSTSSCSGGSWRCAGALGPGQGRPAAVLMVKILVLQNTLPALRRRGQVPVPRPALVHPLRGSRARRPGAGRQGALAVLRTADPRRRHRTAVRQVRHDPPRRLQLIRECIK